ncbi:MAG: MgtC/SapB family protein [Lysobacter sp.]
MPALPDDILGLGVALGVGLLIGVERERAKGTGRRRAAAGVRTFALLGLVGGLAHLVGASGVAVAGIFVTLAMLASYRRSQAADPGLTTEVAMLATFFLGVLAMRMVPVAAGLGVVVALVLASKSTLHRFTRQVLSAQELHDLLLLTAAAFVVLPLLPDRTIDPWEAINPRKLWLLVIAVMAVSSAGYVALRAFGSRLGLALAGLAGGFVSSTATIAAMGDRARASPQASAAFASAGLVSNVGTIIQLTIVMAALSPELLRHAAWPLAAAGMVAVGAAVVSSWRAFSASGDAHDLAGKRPFEPVRVLAFVSILAVIVLLAAIARHWLGAGSLPWVLAASGLADVHAAAASAAQLVATGQVDADQALLALLAALTTNSLMKCVVAALKGGRHYAARVIPGIVLMVVAFAMVMGFTLAR